MFQLGVTLDSATVDIDRMNMSMADADDTSAWLSYDIFGVNIQSDRFSLDETAQHAGETTVYIFVLVYACVLGPTQSFNSYFCFLLFLLLPSCPHEKYYTIFSWTRIHILLHSEMPMPGSNMYIHTPT
jgi:hypothetical protein